MDIHKGKILVTGADGFIGSHLVEYLLEKGCKVRALVQYNSFNSWGWLDEVENSADLEVISGDVRDPSFCLKMTEEVDIVFHLAALIAIPYSYIAPDSYVDTNIRGTLNICQASLKNGVKRVIHTSTSEVYGTAHYVPMDENHPLQPQSPYSASKIGADAMAQSFYNSFSLPVIIARPFNTYGARQSARAVIPTIITQIAAGHKEIKVGDLSPTRDFNYVLDTCKGFYQLAQCDPAVGQTVNIGAGREDSVEKVLNTIKELMQSSVTFICDEQRIRPKNSEVFRLCCDNSRLVELTGFAPEYDLQRGLAQTISWFCNKENLRKYKTDIYNV